jgi:ABC-type multidrug transport system fused ATPase/permease subunit
MTQSANLIKSRFWREGVIPALKANRNRLTIAVIALFILAAANAVVVFSFGPIFKILFVGQQSESIRLLEVVGLSSDHFLAGVFDLEITRVELSRIVPVLLVVAAGARAWASYTFQMQQQVVSANVSMSVRGIMVERIFSRPYRELRNHGAGEWMSVVMNDVAVAQSRLIEVMIGLVRDVSIALAASLSLFVINFRMACVIVLVLPLMVFGMSKVGAALRFYADQIQTEMRKLASQLLGLRQRFDFVRSQGGEIAETAALLQTSNRMFHSVKKLMPIRVSFAPVAELVGFLCFALILHRLNLGQSAGHEGTNVMQLLVAVGIAFKPLKGIGDDLSQLYLAKGILRRIFDVFGFEQGTNQNEPEQAIIDAACQLRGDGLSVRQNDSVVVKVDGGVQIGVGKSICIVGPSGSGKSTLIKSLAGLLEPETWLGMSVKWEKFWRTTSFASQTPFLFQDSIRNNLFYNPRSVEANDRDGRVSEVLQGLGLDDWIGTLPQGLDTVINPMLGSVSGGQLQRLVLARAILRGEKSMWLFDEATSAVESTLDRRIWQNILKWAKKDGKGVIAVSHRLDGLSEFDEVWFCENGRRVFCGPHADLLSHNRYREFVHAGQST